MIIVRPIRDEDLDNLMRLAKAAYPGMTTLSTGHGRHSD
jgi:arginine/ornithine N-succinyltransferase beta subunit